MTAVDEEVSVDVDLDAAVPCELDVMLGGCSNEANWRGTLRCCGGQWNACDTCLVIWRKHVKDMEMLPGIHPNISLSCPMCDGPWLGADWRPL